LNNPISNLQSLISFMNIDGTKVTAVLTHVANVIEQNKDYLCALDSEVGDGDHGVSMTIGMRTARKVLAVLQNPTPQIAFQAVSDAFADEVGAASGVMYEVGFAAAAQAAAGKAELNEAADWAAILEAIADAIQTIGKAELGDKTMLDAWRPAAQVARSAAQSNESLNDVMRKAVAAAWDGVQRTKDLIPKRGRASRLGERARGYQDAGATSAYLIMNAIQGALI
jgi:phosphoenolpyruvate---glycerone phosphotransferase subunit DhaL